MKIPFSFWGGAELKLPVVTNLKLLNSTQDQLEVEATLAFEGTETPMTEVGFLLSTNPDPVQGGPGVVQQTGTIPNPTPGTFSTTFTGLTAQTAYYIRAYGINQEGISYTESKVLETQWNAFTFTLDPQYVQSYGFESGQEIWWIGTVGTSNFTLNGVTIPYGDANIRVKISQPSNPNYDDVIVDRSYTSATYAKHRVLVPMSEDWDSSDIHVQIIAQTNATGNFNNFAFNWVRETNAYTEWQQGLTTALATTTVTQWGDTKWVTLYTMFNGTGTPYANDSSINKRNSIALESAGVPDLTECVSMDYAWYYNYKQNSNNNFDANNVANADPELSTWNFSNVKSMRSVWEGTYTGNGRQISWDNLNFESCEAFNKCFKGSKIGTTNPTYDNTLKNWTFNQDANQQIDFSEMFAFCDRIEDIEIFDINTAVTNKMSFFAMFYYCSSLVGTNLSVWGTKFSQNVGLDSSSDVSASSMFRNTGYNSAGLKVDFTTWDFGNYNKLDYFLNTAYFDTTAPNYLTMLTNKTIGSSTGAFNNGTDVQFMFGSARDIPPLHGWTFHYINNMNGMFISINYTTYSVANQLDLSTWKTEIDKLDTNPPAYTGNKKLEIYNMFGSNGYTSDVRVPKGVETFEWCVNTPNPPVIRAESLFRNCNGFNRDLNGMDIIHFYDISYMLGSATSFNNGQLAGQNTNPLTFKQGLRPFSAGFPVVNGASVVCNMSGLFAGCYAFDQEVNSWGDVRLFRKMSNMFQDTQSQPQTFSRDIGDWLINPQPGYANNIASAWTTQQMDDTIIGWAKTWLDAINNGETIPQNLLIGWAGTPSNFNNPSCLPAATGGPYNVAADIQSVQDALDFFQQNSWTITTNACV